MDGSQETDEVTFFFFAACGIFVPRPGIEPVLPAAEAQSPNRWTTREFPDEVTFNVPSSLKDC